MTDSGWTLSSYSSFGHAPLARSWQELEGRAQVSCFQSWAWVGTWLQCLPDGIEPWVAVRKAGDVITGLAVLCASHTRRHRVLPVSGWHLTETGSPAWDTLTVEHNAPLAASAHEPFAEGLLDALLKNPRGWDELVLAGLDQNRLAEVTEYATVRGMRLEEFDRKTYYWVDLNQLRTDGKTYLDALSSNTRYQIRRSRRAYEKLGPLTLSVAGTLDEAREYFAALERLHQHYWQARGKPGAFAEPMFRKFHDRFITDHWAAGHVELLRLRAGSEDVGYLYNFVTAGVVSSYQSGFAYQDDQPHLKPGLVAHAAAVERSMEVGHKTYDFLAGKSQYKQSLSLSSDEMVWLRVQRPRLKFALERSARQIVRSLRARRAPATVPGSPSAEAGTPAAGEASASKASQPE